MEEHAESEFALLDYLDELVESLRRRVAMAVRGEDVEAVHEARVATRRLKASTVLLSSVLSDHCRKPFDKITRSLRRQLGPLRDLDVMLEHLAEITDPKFAASREWLKSRMIACRAKVVEGAKENVAPSRVLAKLGAWWGLRQEIVESQEAVDSVLAESIHLQLDAFAEQAEELLAAQKTVASSAVRRSDPHELRIAGKSLRYTLEMAKEHGKPLPAKVMSLFKRMQESLGLWHDYVVLTERMLCETVECDLALHDPELQGQILGLAQITLKKAGVELKKMADLWTNRGEELSREIRENFPLTKVSKSPGDSDTVSSDKADPVEKSVATEILADGTESKEAAGESIAEKSLADEVPETSPQNEAKHRTDPPAANPAA
jgi:CHAD domain-containing protein